MKLRAATPPPAPYAPIDLRTRAPHDRIGRGDVPAPRGGAPMGRRRLGEILLDQGAVTFDALSLALEEQRMRREAGERVRLGEVLVGARVVTTSQIATALATALGLPRVELQGLDVPREVVRLLSRQVCERAGAVLVSATATTATLAVSDPTDVVSLDDLRMRLAPRLIELTVASADDVAVALNRLWSLGADASQADLLVEELDVEPEPADDVSTTDDAPLVRLLNTVLSDAVRARASDVHVEPQVDGVRIRYRVDGVLRDVVRVPRGLARSLVSRVKVTAGLDISQRRVPQDGRVQLTVDGRRYDGRVSTLPGVHGEKVVVRLLPSADDVPALADLGLSDADRETLLAALRAPQGLVLITGPTGSGKTNTLYAGLKEVDSVERNVVTLEDPVEVQLPGLHQVQVDEKSGLTFARGLRAVLRQDPDVVLVGEIRDTETAELALKASLTGHLVLATLHTNDAVGAVTRLVDMGLDPYLVASALSLVVAQRLVRSPCDGCASPDTPDPEVLTALGLVPADLAGATPVRGSGCSRCGGTGYRGRRGVFELLPTTGGPVRAALLRDPTEASLAAAARRAGLVSMRSAALAAAAVGETTYSEALRVTGADEVAAPRCRACRRTLPAEAGGCPWCGTRLTDRCAGCGTALVPGWRFCADCSTPVPEASDSADG